MSDETREETITKQFKDAPQLVLEDLSGIDFTKAGNLRWQALYKCKLDGCKVDWSNRQLLGEILRQAAGDDYGKRRFAGFVLINYDWCWPKILIEAKDDPALPWALSVFKAWVTPGDGAPQCVLDAEPLPQS